MDEDKKKMRAITLNIKLNGIKSSERLKWDTRYIWVSQILLGGMNMIDKEICQGFLRLFCATFNCNVHD